MSTVLTNGIIIPDNGSRNWGGDLANNWNIIDLNVGYMTDVKNRVTTLENSVTTLENSTAENTANIQTNASNISSLQTSKQDVIEDLETIRAGASAGATAVQPSTLNNYVDLSSEQTISGVKTFTNIVRSNKELNFKDTKYDWSDTSLNTWLDAGHVMWLDRTGTRRIHELVGADGGSWNKSCYINENLYFSVNSNREIRFEGNSLKWNGKRFAYAYDTTSVIGNIHVGSVLTGDAKNVAFIVPLNIDGSPAISFDKLVIRGNGNYLFGSTSNSNVTTSYTFTSTIVKGGLIIVLTFSNAETKVPNNSCVVTHVVVRLTY